MRRFVLILLVVSGLCMLLTACGTKRVPPEAQKAVLSYMSEKYNQEFEIEKIEYGRKSTHDPVIPFPTFLEPYSDDFRAVLAVRNQVGEQGEDTSITVYYNHEEKEFTDDYQAELIKDNLLYYVLNKELDNIKEINDCDVYYNKKESTVWYPQGKEGYYDLEQYQPEYAYQYLREHEVSVYLIDDNLNVVCSMEEAEGILSKFDAIFMDLFRGDKTSAVVQFYMPEDKDFIAGDAESFLYVYYSQGERSAIYSDNDSEH